MRTPRRALLLAVVLAFGAGCVEGFTGMPGSEAPAPSTGPPAGQGTLALHVIDVDQGDGILLVTPGGRTLLMDAGSRGSGEEVIAYMRALDVKSLDVFVASHGDADHVGGVGTKTDNVLRAFPPSRVYEPGYPKTTLTYETFLETVEAVGADYYDARDFAPGDELSLDPAVRVTFLHPDVVDEDGEPNDEGIVLRVAYGNFSVILPGDIGEDAERVVLERGVDVASVVLKVGHHGSRGSSTSEWLRAVSPEIAILSVGADNPYGHPHPETMGRLRETGAAVYRTDEHGSVVVTTDGVTWSVTTRG